MPRGKNTPAVTFEDLQQLIPQGATPSCGKRPYTLGRAREAARVRNAVQGDNKTWSAIPCYDMCGGSVFHLTTDSVRAKQIRKFGEGRTPAVFDATRRNREKKRRHKKNRMLYEVISVGTWEDDGGALHPRDLED